MGLSRLAEQCRKCPFKNNCKNKQMEALGYLPEPIVAEAGMPSAAELTQPIFREMENNNKNSLGYKVGQALAFVIGLCIAAILIVLTVKLILWIL